MSQAAGLATVVTTTSQASASDVDRPIFNVFTVDVEDYFHVTAFDQVIRRADWPEIPSRVARSTHRLLDLLDAYHVRGTFFVLGWIAERFPELVREIDRRGHEIGSHSYWHRRIYHQTPSEFRADLRQSKHVLENTIGKPVRCYRAPTFSITRQSWWALTILVEEGFSTDSSIFPIRHDRYGVPGHCAGIHQIETPSGRIWEAPLSVSRCCGLDLPASGGGYFRLYPMALTRRLFRRVNSAGRPVIFYMHPWEIDSEQPRVAGLKRRHAWRHYVNLHRTESKLQQLLSGERFAPLASVVQSHLPAASATRPTDVSQIS